MFALLQSARINLPPCWEPLPSQVDCRALSCFSAPWHGPAVCVWESALWFISTHTHIYTCTKQRGGWIQSFTLLFLGFELNIYHFVRCPLDSWVCWGHVMIFCISKLELILYSHIDDKKHTHRIFETLAKMCIILCLLSLHGALIRQWTDLT